MSVAQWTACSPFAFTRIWASPSFGPFITIWQDRPVPVTVTWNEYSANPPFSFSGAIIMPTPRPNNPIGLIIVGPPSPYVEIWIKPNVGGNFRAT